MVSRQWFVRIKPLAEPAIEAVRSGAVRITPQSWEATYFNWMENIHDWTISRQLWWGHRIPAWYCEACGTIHYQNPKLVVGSIPEYQGKLLLCRRAIEPRYGYWTLPAGFMENDETAAEAALRETLEEAGTRVELGAPFTMISVPHVNQVHLFYRARVLGLEFKPGEESLEVALWDERQIPWKEIAFRTVGLTLKHWFADRGRGAFGFHAEDLK